MELPKEERTIEASDEGRERENEGDRKGERYCLTIRKGYGNIPACVCVFHPDPVGSAGEKHVISAQPVRHGQSDSPSADASTDTDVKIHTV